MLFLIIFISLILSLDAQAFIPERPAILIHGIGVRGGLTWEGIPFLRYLNLQSKSMTDFLVESSGYTLGENLLSYDYDTLDPIEHIASEFATFLDEFLKSSNSESVDLICFSMGGLIARTYLNGTKDPPVKNLITIGTPHRGSYWVEIAEQIKPQSSSWFFTTLETVLSNAELPDSSLGQETYRFLDRVYRFSEYPSLGQMEPEGEFIKNLENYYIPPEINVTCIAGLVLPAFDSALVPESLVEKISERFGAGDLIVPLESALWKNADQTFIVKGPADTTWHSSLTYNPEVQALVKYILSRDYMFSKLESFQKRSK
ncbi:MAG: alpha/beta fold hydrolase [Firmicutes bacterium]|nr:alpha/beta fold hydrolase [Bacillota bacterium]MDD4693410.1 alpha/beta fold hydrolase [Bacillota bacterium]